MCVGVHTGYVSKQTCGSDADMDMHANTDTNASDMDTGCINADMNMHECNELNKHHLAFSLPAVSNLPLRSCPQ